MMSINNLTGISLSIAGYGTSLSMHKATSPRGILQYIINFFTCGGVRKDNERMYEKLMESMANTLTNSAREGVPLPEKLILDDINGCTVTFTMPGMNNYTRDVTLEVRRGNDVALEYIPKYTYVNVCKVLQFRKQFNLIQLVPLTEERKMNLCGCYLSNADLRGLDLSAADLSGANLKNANLSGADLSGSTLSDTDLSGCNLCFAKLACADLNGADLSGANLNGADLSGADLPDGFRYRKE
ncbi:pentapeptide repeat-containing protein [Yersinia enterocolitica]